MQQQPQKPLAGMREDVGTRMVNASSTSRARPTLVPYPPHYLLPIRGTWSLTTRGGLWGSGRLIPSTPTSGPPLCNSWKYPRLMPACCKSTAYMDPTTWPAPRIRPEAKVGFANRPRLCALGLPPRLPALAPRSPQRRASGIFPPTRPPSRLPTEPAYPMLGCLPFAGEGYTWCLCTLSTLRACPQIIRRSWTPSPSYLARCKGPGSLLETSIWSPRP